MQVRGELHEPATISPGGGGTRHPLHRRLGEPKADLDVSELDKIAYP